MPAIKNAPVKSKSATTKKANVFYQERFIDIESAKLNAKAQSKEQGLLLYIIQSQRLFYVSTNPVNTNIKGEIEIVRYRDGKIVK